MFQSICPFVLVIDCNQNVVMKKISKSNKLVRTDQQKHLPEIQPKILNFINWIQIKP